MKPFLLVSALFLAGCVHKPLITLPTAEQARIAELEKENAGLRQSLFDLEKNCSAVLRIFRNAGDQSRLPASKEK